RPSAPASLWAQLDSARARVHLGISKRREYENAKSWIRFDGNGAFVCRKGIRGTGEDRLRPQRKLRPIQNLFVGTGQDEGPPECRSNQEFRQYRTVGERLDSGGFGRRCFGYGRRDNP